MKQEIDDLKNLPLSFLISAPLNAAIEAQRNSAMTTAAFIEKVGFIPPAKDKLSLFSDKGGSASTGYRVREAVIGYQQDELQKTGTGGNGQDVYDVVATKRELRLPYLSMVNIPMFDVSEVMIDFNARLKGVTQIETDFEHENTSKMNLSANGSLDGGSLGIPVNIGASMTVESSSQTKFGLRYGEGHEAEYNLHVQVKAVQAPQPKGIERLLSLAERIVDASERANAEYHRLRLAQVTPSPAPVPAPAPAPVPPGP